LSDELYAQVKARGGSPWARGLIEEALQPVTAAQLKPPEGNGKGDLSRKVTPVEKLCPRWMHHRRDVFCKTCGQTPAGRT